MVSILVPVMILLGNSENFSLQCVRAEPLRQKAESLGSGDFSPLWAGQNVFGCRAVPARQLTRDFVRLLG
jgi:nitronate monooxygenase